MLGPGNIDQARAFPRLAKQLLDHVIVRLRPVPGAPELPTVNDIADQINHVSLMISQEVEYSVSLAAPGPKMQIGQKQCAILTCCLTFHHNPIVHFAPAMHAKWQIPIAF